MAAGWWVTSLVAAATAVTSPASWKDPQTGHRIVRIDDSPGNYALYFNYNAFTPKGDRMVYLTAEGIRTVNLHDWSTRLVLRMKVDRLLFAGTRTNTAYYTTRAANVDDGGPVTLWAVSLDTGKTRRIADVPGGRIETINADETLLAGQRELEPPPPEIARQGRRDPRTGSPAYAGTGADGKPLSFADAKAQWMEARLASRVPMEMFTIDIRTGERRTVHRATDWLNHLQFSPKDPGLLMFCHEGPWDKVDRIWTIRTDGTALRKVHQRSMVGEIAGHEFWSPDGKTIWYDLQTPRNRIFWLASYDVLSGERRQYAVRPDQLSVHFNIAPDLATFAGDGTYSSRWISLFKPVLTEKPAPGLIAPGELETERLVDMAHQDYTLEPNLHYTPDGKWLVFRGNMEGRTAIYAVEIASKGAGK